MAGRSASPERNQAVRPTSGGTSVRTPATKIQTSPGVHKGKGAVGTKALRTNRGC